MYTEYFKFFFHILQYDKKGGSVSYVRVATHDKQGIAICSYIFIYIL